VAATLNDKGFNAREGFFHIARGRHAALASDLIEPLRHIADRIVLALIHQGEITPAYFDRQEHGGQFIWRMNGKGFRTFIGRYEWTMASSFTPHKGRKMSYNEWLDETVECLKRAVRFDLPYEPLRIS
jgi:CRISPR/Cas system-associated endonuclease Cas1